MISHFSPDLVAAKELEELERWKKQQREKSINLPPMTLGKQQASCLNAGGQGRPTIRLAPCPHLSFDVRYRSLGHCAAWNEMHLKSKHTFKVRSMQVNRCF